MSTQSKFLFLLLLIGSAFLILLELKIALIAMLIASLMGLSLLCIKSFHKEGETRIAYWWAWSLHGLLLIAIYMALFGVANIVGSGRKFSARMAVSTLRTLHWAERQCSSEVGRFCTIAEMKLESRAEGLKTALLRSDFHRVVAGDDGQPIRPQFGQSLKEQEYGLLGQYLIMLRATPERGDKAWIAYAWPSSDRTLQTFCIDHREEILELPVDDQGEALYLGLSQAPRSEACLGDLHHNPNPPLTEDMKRAIAAGDKPPPHTHLGQDRRSWQRWRGKRTRISKSKQ